MRKLSFAALFMALVFMMFQVCAWAGEMPVTFPKEILEDSDNDLVNTLEENGDVFETLATEEVPAEEETTEAADADESDTVEETADAEEITVESDTVEETADSADVAEETISEEIISEEIVYEDPEAEEVIFEEIAEEDVTSAEELLEEIPEDFIADEVIFEEAVPEEPAAEELTVEELTVEEQPVFEADAADDFTLDEITFEEDASEEDFSLPEMIAEVEASDDFTPADITSEEDDEEDLTLTDYTCEQDAADDLTLTEITFEEEVFENIDEEDLTLTEVTTEAAVEEDFPAAAVTEEEPPVTISMESVLEVSAPEPEPAEEKTVLSETAVQQTETKKKEDTETKQEQPKADSPDSKAAKLAAPVLGTVTCVDGGLKITWSKVKGAEGYYIYYWNTDKKKYIKFAMTSSTSYIDTTPKTDRGYYYTVTAYNANGESDGDYNGIFGAYTPAAKVTSLYNTEKGLTLKWKEVSSAQGYRIYYRRSGEAWKVWKDVTGTTSLTGISGQSGITYEYAVVPYRTIKGVIYEGAHNLESSKKVTYLDVPNLKSAKAVQNGIRLKWDAVEGAKGYIIYWWHPTNKQYYEIGYTKSTSYIDTTAKAGKNYWYTVAAYKGDSVGAYSYAGIQGVYLPASQITTLKSTIEGLTLKWSSVSGADGYKVYWRYLGDQWHFWQDVTTTSLTGISYKVNTGYEYCIIPYKTVKGTQFQGYYDEGSYKTIGGLPGVPKLVSATSSGSGITITWNAVDGATKYYLYWKPLSGTSEWQKFAETTSTQYLDTSAAGTAGFYYTVQAVNENGVGKYDNAGIMGATSDVIAKATAMLDRVGWNLRAAYNWSAQINYTRNYTGMTTSTAAVYAFNNYIGDCVAKASSFYWMAKVLGYTNIRVIMGQVPYAAGGYGDHAWVEIDQNGVTYVCDPDFEWDEGRNGYFITYGQSGTWVYKYGYILSDF